MEVTSLNELWHIGRDDQYMAALEGKVRRYTDVLLEVVKRQRELTMEIVRLSEALRQAQIEEGTRRLAVRWWKIRGGEYLVRVEPVLVRWKRVQVMGQVRYRGIRCERLPRKLGGGRVEEIVREFAKVKKKWMKIDRFLARVTKQTAAFRSAEALLNG